MAGSSGKLAASILDGSLPPGTQMPPERELMSQLEISRSTLREVGKAFGFPDDVLDRYSALFHGGDYQQTMKVRDQVQRAGIPGDHPRLPALLETCRLVQGLPRHLSQHRQTRACWDCRHKSRHLNRNCRRSYAQRPRLPISSPPCRSVS